MQTLQLQAETSLTLEELEAIALGASLTFSDTHWQAVARCR